MPYLHDQARTSVQTWDDDSGVKTLEEIRPSWRNDAACRNVPDPTIFFQGRGEDSRHVLAMYCSQCPAHAKAACLEVGLVNSTTHDAGIYGGTSAKQRRQIRKERTQAAGLSGRTAYVLRDGIATPIPHDPMPMLELAAQRRMRQQRRSEGQCSNCADGAHRGCWLFRAESRNCTCERCNARLQTRPLSATQAR